MAENEKRSRARQSAEKKSNTDKGSGKRTPILIGSIGGAVIIVAAVVVLLLVRGAGKDPVTFDYANLPRLGNASAPVKIVEFGDFKCTACKYFHDHVFPELKSNYIDPGVVRFYFMNFPFIGPDSTTAAEAGLAIYHQDPAAFWNYYNAMYDNQGSERNDWATPTFILRLATHEVPGINYTLLGQQIAKNTYKSAVQAQYDKGIRLGVNGTPTLFINGHQFLKFSNWTELKAAIEKYK